MRTGGGFSQTLGTQVFFQRLWCIIWLCWFFIGNLAWNQEQFQMKTIQAYRAGYSYCNGNLNSRITGFSIRHDQPIFFQWILKIIQWDHRKTILARIVRNNFLKIKIFNGYKRGRNEQQLINDYVYVQLLIFHH